MTDMFISFLEINFQKFNKMFFNNELPEIKFKLSRAKTYLGCFVYKNNVACDIMISDYYNLSEHEICEVLIHEMIHYYIFYKKINDSSTHGYIFRKMAAEISSKSSYNITVTASYKKLTVNNKYVEKKSHTNYYIMKFFMRNRICYGRVPEDFDKERFIKRHRDSNPIIYISNKIDFDTWRCSRNNSVTYRFEDDEINKLCKDLKIFK